MEEQKQQTHARHKTKEGPIWDTTSSNTVLEAIFRHPEGIGFQTEWV